MQRHEPVAAKMANQHLVPAKNYALRFFNGTISNFISTLAVLPLQYIWTSKQDPKNPQDYKTSIKFVATASGIRKVYSASSDVLKLAPKQSLAYLGISNAILDYYQTDPIVVRGLKAGVASSFFETTLTVKDVHRIISKWCTYDNPPIQFGDARFTRCLAVSFARNVIANPLTLINVLYIKHHLNQYFYPGTNSAPAAIAAAAGMAGSILTATAIAPIVLLQTYTMRDPSHPISYHLQKITSMPLRHAWTGNGGRAVTKGIQGMITFGLLNATNRFTNQLAESKTQQTQIAANPKKIES